MSNVSKFRVGSFLINKATRSFIRFTLKFLSITKTPAASPAKMLLSNLKNPALIAAIAPCRFAIEETVSVPIAASIA